MILHHPHKPQSSAQDAVPRSRSTMPRRHRKASLVDLGLWGLSRGEWRIVQALTCLVQREGLTHE